jgi:hypothetical protein
MVPGLTVKTIPGSQQHVQFDRRRTPFSQMARLSTKQGVCPRRCTCEEFLCNEKPMGSSGQAKYRRNGPQRHQVHRCHSAIRGKRRICNGCRRHVDKWYPSYKIGRTVAGSHKTKLRVPLFASSTGQGGTGWFMSGSTGYYRVYERIKAAIGECWCLLLPENGVALLTRSPNDDAAVQLRTGPYWGSSWWEGWGLWWDLGSMRPL